MNDKELRTEVRRLTSLIDKGIATPMEIVLYTDARKRLYFK